MPASPPRRPLRLRLTAPRVPWKLKGQETEFGLLDRQGALEDGVLEWEGPVIFTVDLEVSRDPATGAVRYYSPFVHGREDGPYLYLGWRYRDEPRSWLRRRKVPLTSITWKAIDTAPLAPVTFAAEVPSVQDRRAVVAPEWSLIETGPDRTLFRMLIRFPPPDLQEGVRKNVHGVSDGLDVEWHESEYDERQHLLIMSGKLDTRDPDAVHEALLVFSHGAWDALEDYGDVYLVLNPEEPGERVLMAVEEDYEEYREMLMEMGIDPGPPADLD